MNKLGAYIFLLMMCVPGLYVFFQLVKDEYVYIKHRIKQHRDRL
jgi:hypothetical protein